MLKWLTKAWEPPPQPVKEPEYSELGTELYRLLEESEGQWSFDDGRHNGYVELHHFPSSLTIELKEDWSSGVNIRQGNRDYPNWIHRLFTEDDRKRLWQRSVEVAQRKQKHRQQEEMKRVLEKIKPNPFNANARALARCVLSGDESAAKPLIDACIEQLQKENW